MPTRPVVTADEVMIESPFNRGAKVYGRVERIDGGVIYVRTPGGSLFYSGAMWVRRIEEAADFAKLAEFDLEAGYVDPWMAL